MSDWLSCLILHSLIIKVRVFFLQFYPHPMSLKHTVLGFKYTGTSHCSKIMITNKCTENIEKVQQLHSLAQYADVAFRLKPCSYKKNYRMKNRKRKKKQSKSTCLTYVKIPSCTVLMAPEYIEAVAVDFPRPILVINLKTCSQRWTFCVKNIVYKPT